MSRVCLISDLHWGGRNDAQSFVDFFERFYKQTFFPTLEKEGIDTVIILGDVFDRRKYISFVILEQAKRILFNELAARNIKTFVLVGNHDTPYKNSIRVNAVDLLLSDYENITIINTPQEVEIADTKICMIPWICADNVIDAMTLMECTDASICMGHFEITGFSMYRGAECRDGMDQELFDRFECVFSGHYHHKSSYRHIHYIGNPYELTWQDYNDPRGFHIFDLKTRELEFIQNPHQMFYKIHYDDQLWESRDVIDNMPYEKYNKSYVKVVVRSKNNPLWFDMFIDKLEKNGVEDIQVVDDHLHLDLEDDEDIVNEAEDTMTILRKCVDGLTLQSDVSKKLDSLFQSLYQEAMSVQ